MKIKITPQLEYSLSDEDVYNIFSQGSLRDFITQMFNLWKTKVIKYLLSEAGLKIPPNQIIIINNKLYRKERIDYGYGDCRYSNIDLNIEISDKSKEIFKGFEDLLGVI